MKGLTLLLLVGGAMAAQSVSADVQPSLDAVRAACADDAQRLCALSNLGQYHFTDGFGNYRTTDDPNYTPEQAGEVGSWSRMTTAP
jgi:hypothetical protein